MFLVVRPRICEEQSLEDIEDNGLAKQRLNDGISTSRFAFHQAFSACPPPLLDLNTWPESVAFNDQDTSTISI